MPPKRKRAADADDGEAATTTKKAPAKKAPASKAKAKAASTAKGGRGKKKAAEEEAMDVDDASLEDDEPAPPPPKRQARSKGTSLQTQTVLVAGQEDRLHVRRCAVVPLSVVLNSQCRTLTGAQAYVPFADRRVIQLTLAQEPQAPASYVCNLRAHPHPAADSFRQC
ncbi:hypothetical protein EXIGLDRAFT_831667, partial [Exidia glandulosa HHB12029]